MTGSALALLPLFVDLTRLKWLNYTMIYIKTQQSIDWLSIIMGCCVNSHVPKCCILSHSPTTAATTNAHRPLLSVVHHYNRIRTHTHTQSFCAFCLKLSLYIKNITWHRVLYDEVLVLSSCRWVVSKRREIAKFQSIHKYYSGSWTVYNFSLS